MLSITIFVALFLVSITVGGWLVARVARAVGATRASTLRGIAAMISIQASTIVMSIVECLVPSPTPRSAPFVTAAAVLANIVLAFFAFKIIFALRTTRTFAPFGAWIGWQAVLLAFALLLLKPLIVEAFVMPTESMSPTLAVRDRFTVNKLLTPQRFDVIAYRVVSSHPKNAAAVEIYCKRLVGLPGETLVFDGSGGLTISGQSLTLPSAMAGRLHAVPKAMRGFSEPGYADGQPIALAADEIFVIGDNVDLSADSRTYGPSKLRDVVGVADCVYWPLSSLKQLR